MMLWLIFAVMILAVLALLVSPLIRKAAALPPRAAYDIAVYRDQLAEVDRDVERGLLESAQAETARVEIYRRMLAAEDASTLPQTRNSKRGRLALALVILVVVPVGASLMYAYLGSPELPGKPYAARKNDPEFAMAAEADRLAAQLESQPDSEGYERLADLYSLLRRYDQAAEAYRKIIDREGGNAAVWAQYGEAIALAGDGLVGPEARVAFAKALQLDSHNARALFYLGLAETQIDEPRRAVAIWKYLEHDSSPGAPWLAMVREHIAIYAKKGGFDAASVKPAPPSMAP